MKLPSLQTVLLFAMLSLACAKRCGDPGDDAIVILYPVINTRPEAGETFWAFEAVHVQPGTTTFDMMLTAEGCNDKMTLTYSMSEHGAYIEGINGVMADVSQELFWAFMKVDANGRCLHNYGVSTIVPADGEIVLMSMEYYSIFDEVPNCETGVPEPHFHYLGGR